MKIEDVKNLANVMSIWPDDPTAEDLRTTGKMIVAICNELKELRDALEVKLDDRDYVVTVRPAGRRRSRKRVKGK